MPITKIKGKQILDKTILPDKTNFSGATSMSTITENDFLYTLDNNDTSSLKKTPVSLLDNRFVNTSGDTINGDLYITGTVTGNTLNINSATIGNVSNTEIQYLDGVTSNIQTQINSVSGSIGNGQITVNSGSGLTGSGTFTVNQTGTTTVTLSHADTSSASNIIQDNSNGIAIQDISVLLDTYGHVTGATAATYDLDNRYYTETESNSRFVNTTGDTITGDITINGNTYITGAVTGNTLTVNSAIIGNVSNTELQHLDGITSNIQTQINSVSGSIGNGQININTGSGLSGSGTFTVNQTGTTTVTLSHADTSSASNINSTNSNGTVIQSLTASLDTYGHVTGTSVNTIDLDQRFVTASGFTVDNSMVRTVGTTGRIIEQTGIIITDTNDINIPTGSNLQKNSTNYLIDNLLSGSIGAAGTIPVSAGSTSTPVWTSLSSANLSNNTNLVKYDDATKTFTGVGVTTLPGTLVQKSLLTNESATLGSELLTSSNWTTTGWTGDFTTGFTHTTGNVTSLTNTLAAVTNNIYQIAFTVTNRTTGSFTVTFGNELSNITFTSTNAWGVKATGTGSLSITPTTNFNGTIVISIKQITGTYSATYTLQNSSGSGAIEFRSGSVGLNNQFIGVGSGRYNTTGYNNTFNGYNSGYSNTTGYNNTFNGLNSGYSNTTGYQNTFNGLNSGYSNTTGYHNTFNGVYSGSNNTTGSQNTFNGFNSGSNNTTGYQNTFNGVYSGYFNTTGYNNTFNGVYSGHLNTTGYHNTFNGVHSGYNLGRTKTAGTFIVGLNYQIVSVGNTDFTLIGSTNNTVGTNFTATGVGTGTGTAAHNTNGLSTYGYNSGRYLANGSTAFEAATNSSYFGADTKASADGVANENVFGYGAIGSGSNTVTIGNTSVTATYLKGNITTTGTIEATTAKLTNLSDNKIPYHVSDATGLADSPITVTGNCITVTGCVYSTGLTISNKITFNYQENLDVDTTAPEMVAQVSSSSYTAAFFDYVVKNGTNMRAETLTAVHDGTYVEFTEYGTNDLGDTSQVTFTCDLSGGYLRLLATVTSDNWIIKTIVRSL